MTKDKINIRAEVWWTPEEVKFLNRATLLAVQSYGPYAEEEDYDGAMREVLKPIAKRLEAYGIKDFGTIRRLVEPLYEALSEYGVDVAMMLEEMVNS